MVHESLKHVSRSYGFVPSHFSGEDKSRISPLIYGHVWKSTCNLGLLKVQIEIIPNVSLDGRLQNSHWSQGTLSPIHSICYALSRFSYLPSRSSATNVETVRSESCHYHHLLRLSLLQLYLHTPRDSRRLHRTHTACASPAKLIWRSCDR